MYIVIAGLSDIGKNLAELLVKEGNEVLVIDRDPVRCAAILTAKVSHNEFPNPPFPLVSIF